MPHRRLRTLVPAAAVAVAALLSAACTAAVEAPPAAAGAAPSPPAPAALQVAGFLGEYRIAPGSTYANTTVGGFSGLDRDPRTGGWFIVSDDRSDQQPSRFYTAQLHFDGADGALSGVELTGTHPFLRPDSTTYPPLDGGDGTTVDPEDIRVDPVTGQLVWTQEGERIVPTDGTAPTLIDPTVRFARPDGGFVAELPVPDAQRADAGERGIRQNLGPEGLTFAADGSQIVTALEAPLLQDGPIPTTTAGARSRIVVETREGQVTAEYAYPQEPIFAEPVPADALANNGVSALLAVDAADRNRFLLMERSFVSGVGNKIRIYQVDLSGETPLAAGQSLADAHPVRKQLLLDVSDLPIQSVDNVEGMAWGPDRPDGTRTLVLVSDDNFADSQVTQFIALAVR